MIDDLRFAWRTLLHTRGFTVVAILTVALAVGANTAIFSIADAVLFRPLSYGDPDALHVVQMMNPSTAGRFALVRWADLRAIREEHRGVGDVATVEFGPTVVATTPTGPESIPTAAVSANYFQVLGVRAIRGRLFAPADATAGGRAAVLSYEAWATRFGRDERIVGDAVAFGGTRYDIVGVLPPGMVFPSPLAGKPQLVVLHDIWDGGPNSGSIYPLVRLEPGVTRDQAQAELDTLARSVRRVEPKLGAAVPVLEPVRSVMFPAGRAIMRFLLAASVLVLLIGCANLANMFLARAKRRERDLGVRAALGASRGRLLRPLIFEAAIIGLAGAALALVVTKLSFEALLRQVPPIAYGAAPVGVDLRVVVFGLILGGAAGALFAAVAACRTSRMDVLALIQRRMTHASGISRRFGRPMLAAQVAIAVVLVFGAALTARAFVSILQVPLGFTPENVVTVRVFPSAGGGVERQNFYLRLIERIASHPDVLSAGAASSMPLDGAAMFEGIPGPDGRQMIAGIDHVLPGYFESIGARLLGGRLLQAQDVSSGADVAVVTDNAVRVLFPGKNPVGAVFRSRTGREFTVVGVVGDIRGRLDAGGDTPIAYVAPGADTRGMVLAVRLRTRSDAVLANIKREAEGLAPGRPVTVEWWSDALSALTVYRNPRFQSIVLGSFAALALVLTATGIFGLMSFVVASRENEMGVRLAVGATPGSLMKLLLKRAMTPVACGLVLGLAATWGLRASRRRSSIASRRETPSLLPQLQSRLS